MKENPIKFSNSANPHHDQLIEQLNKIRECYPCDNQPNCMDYQYVQKATDTVIKEFHLENSFTGKLLARSFCWMSAEESRLMRIVEKEGAMIEPQSFYPMDDESLSEEFYNPAESEDFNSENRENPELIGEPHPLWEVINDLRESMRDSIRLMAQMTKIT